MTAQRKVGIMFAASLVLLLGFAWLMGSFSLFSNSYHLNILYNYAGGIEVGSPVRVMGIKVGKVDKIDFDVNQKDSRGEEVKLRIKIRLDKKVHETIRQDSKFFINLAGLIGEKFLEISPGTLSQPVIEAGTSIRGEDPPRVDQLISQSYGLAGKIVDLISKNEGSITHTLELLDRMVTNMNKTLVQLDKTTSNIEVARMLKNLVEVSEALRELGDRVRSPEGKRTLTLLHDLIWRLEPMDRQAIKDFLQKEGIRAKIF